MRKPTHADAQLLLHLYEIRREPELRQARAWFLSEFKPVSWADIKSRWLSHAEEATVLGSQLQENRGIHLWLQLPDVPEPRAYVLPWNRATAERLQQAQREAQEQGGEVRMRLPFEPSLDDRAPQFYAPPQPALPPKDYAEPEPEFYQQPGRDA